MKKNNKNYHKKVNSKLFGRICICISIFEFCFVTTWRHMYYLKAEFGGIPQDYTYLFCYLNLIFLHSMFLKCQINDSDSVHVSLVHLWCLARWILFV